MGSLHTKIASDGDVTIYKRIDGDVVAAGGAREDVVYIIVDHWTRTVVYVSTEEQASHNVLRVRDVVPSNGD
jgi:hypothetical protein